MSHSDDFKQQFLELYKLKQSGIASALHSNLAQPIVAAKNFAAAINNIDASDENLLEAKQLAQYIVELTDQAYTVAYDLMVENKSGHLEETYESPKLTIESYAELLRFKSRGVTLNVDKVASSIALSPLMSIVLLDWVKSFLIYLARQTKASIINVSLMGDDSGFNLEIDSNVSIDSAQLCAEPLVINMREQIQVFDGSLLIEHNVSSSFVKIFLPANAGI